MGQLIQNKKMTCIFILQKVGIHKILFTWDFNNLDPRLDSYIYLLLLTHLTIKIIFFQEAFTLVLFLAIRKIFIKFVTFAQSTLVNIDILFFVYYFRQVKLGHTGFCVARS